VQDYEDPGGSICQRSLWAWRGVYGWNQAQRPVTEAAPAGALRMGGYLVLSRRATRGGAWPMLLERGCLLAAVVLRHVLLAPPHVLGERVPLEVPTACCLVRHQLTFESEL
jgi:hypothetical protein